MERHFACFGSSGSGKTVACKAMIEEMARSGIPVIAFDPQGDIASLGIHEKESVVRDAGTDPKIREDYVNNVEVVVWTPGSTKGMPLSLNPFRFDGTKVLSEEDRTNYFSSTAKNIIGLIGYDPETDEGKSNETLLSIIFDHCVQSGTALKNFSDLIVILENIPEKINTTISTISDKRSISGLVKKLSLLTLGSRKFLFQNGVPLDINVLMGKDESSDKTRISVIYLNCLNSSREKEFFVSEVIRSLYHWMLLNPIQTKDSQIQCAMFIDEIAPYIPPVKVPASKENLELLFRQGRKYGVSNLIATQSPGDIDYKAIGQFSTLIIGTLNTKQDIEKIKKRLESLAPNEVGSIIQRIPSLKPGEFIVVSPGAYSQAQTINVRWLVTEHRVIPETKLKHIIPNNLLDFYKDKVLDNDHGQDEKTQDQNISSNKISKSDHVVVVENNIFERDLVSKVSPHLSGRFFKKERLVGTVFKYIPIIRVKLTFEDKKGLFKKTISKIDENLYLDYKSYNLFYAEDNIFKFSPIVDADPNEIYDLDNCCTLVSKQRNQVDFDFRVLGGKKLNKSKVKNAMERKYRVQVLDSDLVLFPVWDCKIENKKTGDSKRLSIDGIFGNPINWNV